MKAKNIFALLGLSFAVGIGVAAGAAFNPLKEVKADDTTTIYCKMTYGWWTIDNAAIGVHYWGGESATDWPGVKMTKVATDTGVWKFDVPSDSTNLIFTRVDSSGKYWNAKTDDLSMPTDNKILYTITSETQVWDPSKVSGEWSEYEEPAPVDPTTIKYYYKIGDGEWNDSGMVYDGSFVYDDDKTGYRFRVGGVSASAGDLVQFRKGDSERIYPGASSTNETYGKNNLVWGTSNDIKVLCNCSARPLLLFVYETGYDSFLGGYTENNQTYYFTNNKGWSGAPKYHAFDILNNPKDEWPGVEMTFVDVDGNGQSRYSFTIDINRWANVIFANQDGSQQTNDLQFSLFEDNGAYLTGESSPYGVDFYHYEEMSYVLFAGENYYPLELNEGTEYVAHNVNLTAGQVLFYTAGGVYADGVIAKPVANNNISSEKKVISSIASADVYVDISAKTIWASGLPTLSNGYHLYVNTTVHALTEKTADYEYYSTLLTFAVNDEIRFIHIQNNAAPVIFGDAAVEGGPKSSNFEYDDVKGCIVAKSACDSALYFKQGSPNNVWFADVSEELKQAKEFADSFNKALAAVCKSDGTTDKEALWTAWDAKKTTFAGLDEDVQDILKEATKTHDVEEIREFIKKYELIGERYGTFFATKSAQWNFLGKTITPNHAIELSDIINIESTSMIAIISVIALASISAVAALVIVRKRRHN